MAKTKKLLAFLGLANDGEVVVKSHRSRRQSEYVRKIQSLVVSEDDGAPTLPKPEPEKKAEEQPLEKVEKPEKAEKPSLENSGSDRTKGGFMGKMHRLVDNRRKPESSGEPLILVRKDVEGLLNDVEEALLEGRTLLVDFASEEPRVARVTAERLASFVKMKKGYFFPVTATSLLISLKSDAVVEWLPQEEEEPGLNGAAKEVKDE